MPQISLAKALKLKNRLAGRLNKVQSDIQTYNSVLAEQANQVDVPALCKLRDQIAESLVVLKTKIVFGNSEIQADLIRQGELKSKLAWLATLETRDGKERHGYQNTEVTWVASVKKKDVDQETKKLEAEIDAIQDKLDSYNHTKKIEVSDEALNLAS
jgi:uncharacterized protein with HEPN domain